MSIETRSSAGRSSRIVRDPGGSAFGDGPGVTSARPAGHGAPQWLIDYQARIVLTDIAIITLVVAFSIQLRWGSADAQVASGLDWVGGAGIAAVIGLVWALALVVNGAWERKILGAGTSEYRRIFNASCGTFLILITASYLLQADLARGYMAILIPFGLTALIVGRASARSGLRRRRRRNEHMSNVLVIGDGSSAPRLAQILARTPGEGLRVTGICVPTDDEITSGERITYVKLGDHAALRAVIDMARADLVAVAQSSEFGPEEVRTLAWSLEGTGIGLALAPALTDVAGPRVHIKPISGLPLLHVQEPRFRGPKLLVKTTTDWLVATLALTLLSPVMLAVSVAIKLEDGGPVFFRQHRVGLDGKHFKVVKFRSMNPNADKLVDEVREAAGQTEDVFYKSAGDSRITRIGAIIRKTSLDELPQLLNVFSGDMSLVGPRPLVPGEGAAVDGYLERRMLLKPGMTGLWQVSGRSDVSGDERVRLDMYYIENWSLVGDLAILGKTVTTVLKREGAY